MYLLEKHLLFLSIAKEARFLKNVFGSFSELSDIVSLPFFHTHGTLKIIKSSPFCSSIHFDFNILAFFGVTSSLRVNANFI